MIAVETRPRVGWVVGVAVDGGGVVCVCVCVCVCGGGGGCCRETILR